MFDERKSIGVVTTMTIPLGTLGLITWIVFMILYYGAGVISDWNVFWVWFPLWIVPAVNLALILLVVLLAGIGVGIWAIVNKIRGR